MGGPGLGRVLGTSTSQNWAGLIVARQFWPAKSLLPHFLCLLSLGPSAAASTTVVPTEAWAPCEASVENMASYVICSRLILVINNNMINETNHNVEYVFVGIHRSHGYYHKLTYIPCTS
jgi:hypothetical protein